MVALVQWLDARSSKTAGTSLPGFNIASGAGKIVTLGNTIFVGLVSDDVGSAFTFSDNLGNVYSQVGTTIVNAGAIKAQLWAAPVTVGGNLTQINIAWTTAITAKSAVAAEFTGVGTLNRSGGLQADAATVGSAGPTASSAYNAGELWIGVAGTEDDVTPATGQANGSPSLTPSLTPGSATTGAGSATNIGAALIYAMPSGNGTGFALQWSQPAANYAGQGAVYNPGTPPVTASAQIAGTSGVSATGQSGPKEKVIVVASGSASGVATVTTPNYPRGEGHLMLLVIASRAPSGASSAISSVSGMNSNWYTYVTRGDSGSGYEQDQKVSILYASPNLWPLYDGTIQINFAAVQEQITWQLLQVTGGNRITGRTADNAAASATSLTLTLGSAPEAESQVVGAFIREVSGSVSTPGAGLTALAASQVPYLETFFANGQQALTVNYSLATGVLGVSIEIGTIQPRATIAGATTFLALGGVIDGALPFPSSPMHDNFAGADDTNITGRTATLTGRTWTSPATGYTPDVAASSFPVKIVAEQAQGSGINYSSNAILSGSFSRASAPVEVFATIRALLNTYPLDLWWAVNPVAGAFAFYVASFRDNGVQINRFVFGSGYTYLGEYSAFVPNGGLIRAGHGVGIRHSPDGTIAVYHDSGEGFLRVKAITTDTTLVSGQIGLGMFDQVGNAIADNFGGGNPVVMHQGAASLAGAGSISATGTTFTPVIHTGAATLAGTSAITAAGIRGALGAASLPGAGAITATGVRTALGVASLAGQGAIAPSGQLTLQGAASLQGATTILASGATGIIHQGAASLAGTTATAATGEVTRTASASLAGTSLAQAVGSYTLPGASSLVGTSSLAGAGVRGAVGAASLLGTSGLTATGSYTLRGTAQMAGLGAVFADATLAGLVTGQATLAGLGAITAGGTVERGGAASLAGTSALTGAGLRTATGSATLAGTSGLTGTSQLIGQAAALLAGTGQVAALGTVIQPTASAFIAGTSGITATASVTYAGQAQLAGTSAAQALGSYTLAGVAALAGTSQVTAQGLRTITASALLAGQGAILATGIKGHLGAASLQGLGAILATGRLNMLGAASLAGAGTLTALGGFTRAATAALQGAGLVTATGRRDALGKATLQGQGALLGTGIIAKPGSASLQGLGALSAVAVVAHTGKATILGTSSLQASSGGTFHQGRATLAGTSAVAAIARRELRASAYLVGHGAIAATGRVTFLAKATLAGQGAVAPSGQAYRLATAQITATGLLAASGHEIYAARALLSGQGSLGPASTVLISAKATIQGLGRIFASSWATRPPAPMRIRIEVRNPAGALLPSGPFLEALQASYEQALDQVGSFELSIPATSRRADMFTHANQIDLYREGEGLVFKGTIEHLKQASGPDNIPITVVSGGSTARKGLVHLKTGRDRNFNGATLATIVSALLTGSGYTAGTVDVPAVQATMTATSSKWAALVRAAELFGIHVREDVLASQVDVSAFGTVRAVRLVTTPSASPNLQDSPNMVIIGSVDVEEDSSEIANKLYALGGGEGINVIHLGYGNRSSPYVITSEAGPTYSEFFIRDAASVTAYGERQKYVAVQDLMPLANSSAGFTAAANALYDIVVDEMLRWKDPLKQYAVTVTDLKHLDAAGAYRFEVGDKLPVWARGTVRRSDGTAAWLDVNADLWLTAYKRTFTATGADNWELTLANVDRHGQDLSNKISEVISDVEALKVAHKPYTYDRSAGPYRTTIDGFKPMDFTIRFDANTYLLHKSDLTFRLLAPRATSQTANYDHDYRSAENTNGLTGLTTTPNTTGGGSHSHPSTGGGSHSHVVTGGLHTHAVAAAPSPVSTQAESATHQHAVWATGGAASDANSPTHTHSLNSHTHGSTNQESTVHTHGTNADSPTHGHTVSNDSPAHTHVHEHTHPVNGHVHQVYVGGHAHGVQFNVFVGSLPASPQIGITINGVSRTTALGGPWNTGQTLDITQYLQGANGQPLRQDNVIQISAGIGAGNGLDVEAEVHSLATATSLIPV